MANRYPPMLPLYAVAAVRAEVRRASRVERPIDYDFLRCETGMPWGWLERQVAAARVAKAKQSAAEVYRRPDGGAKPGPGPSPKEPDPDPFASPNRKGKGKGKL